ncbi:hypothetical protein IGB42_00995 [Andreprevotia sp. IGB-42]|uniref:MAC/perforin domain-containing protein n=1 Tax=Andreprevotia sp. IGB-42 TaxID=2497473 RepID=UPI0013583C29|nr:MAC/perforin domain-containing protein [Andreprevotia sp. IGB-42]KAF0814098.1 hypothetical protein IGB42_00995 [Andreprevotia sp. IGB-42]
MSDNSVKSGVSAPVVFKFPGLDLLGRGLNRMDWHSGDGKVGLLVGDTESGEEVKEYGGKSYKIGNKVELTSHTRTEISVSEFSSSNEYERHLEAKVEASGSYGAFSASFEATFGYDIKQMEERESALYSESIQLLKLTIDSDKTTEGFRKAVEKLPTTFERGNSKTFFDFFVTYGADIVSEVILGGSLNYATTAYKRDLDQKTSIGATVTAEYTFIKGQASAKDVEEIKRRMSQHQTNLRTAGGSHGVDISKAKPELFPGEFAKWRQSLTDDLAVVEVKLRKIFEFVGDEKRKAALEQAYEWYTSYPVQVQSSWQDTLIVTGKNLLQAEARSASTAAALRLVRVDLTTEQHSEVTIGAPSPDAGADVFTHFWSQVADELKDARKHQQLVLLATARWPRDRRYVPKGRAREELVAHGATAATIERWEKLTEFMQPCPIAGLSYVLAGSINAPGKGEDGVAAGFGNPGENLKPSVSIHARLAHDSFGRLKLARKEAPLVASNTRLFVLRNNTDSQPALAADPDNRAQLIMQKPDPTNPAHLWYAHALKKRDNYPEINHPTVLFNYETGAVLQGKLDQSESGLDPVRTQEDDVIWDLRGDKVFHLLMVYYHNRSLCLTQIGNRAAVRQWREPHGMDWFREYVTV